ncbi:MAG: EAL domain-containing protein [Gammaproteobacteria bacterium]|nr:EAL domain-containing protein [Gammaproteobacteria bacterium]
MNATSLKLKYAGIAALTVILGASTMVALLLYQAHRDTVHFRQLAEPEARQLIVAGLRAQAETSARHAAVVAGELPRDAPHSVIAAALRPIIEEPAVSGLVLRDPEGRVLWSWQRRTEALASEAAAAAATAPVHHLSQAAPGTVIPLRAGEVEVQLRQPAAEAVAAMGARIESASREDLQHLLGIVTALTLLALAGAVALALWAGRRLERPITALIRSADRIGQGDYSRPLDVARRDEIGALQGALERMRYRLRQTTISRNYLNTMLSSMTDAVFVTSPEGVIRVANAAACRLLGFSEPELLGRSIESILEEGERADFDLLQAAQETRETVVRTRQHQTIPISLSGSQIASEDPQFQGNIFVARNITDRKRAERRIRYLARYDALTKVPNRMQFQHLLQQAIARAARARQALALLYLDLDRFKEVNDTFGHAAGDRTLEILTERLMRHLPKNTVLGRLAGDEFALFIDELPLDADNRGPIAHFVRTLLTEISRPFQLNQQEIYLTSSVGIAFCPRDAENVIDLIRNADAAMYYSKQNGGNTFAFYAPEMNAAAVERLMLKSKLRRALERDELLIRYMPKVDLRTGLIAGAEALLRWRLPGHGDIPPAQFIPLAEESNLILDVGEWVLNRVCRDYRAMQDQVSSPGRVSLNLSLKQLRQASFILRCRSVFREHGVSPTNFELEITETTLMADAKRTVRLLDELYALGLHLSIDDFGTGYSSLSALQQFPIGTLKVDQSFVRGIGDDAGDTTIVRTIIDMGRSLGMEVVAEGIEAMRHIEFLRAHGCQYGQGRLFGEPCTAEELLALLLRQQNGAPPYAGLLPAMAGPDAGGLRA